jgi:stage II sporulation protein D
VRVLAVALAALALAGPAASSSSFTIRGHGWGHGVGMSQWGAEGYALHGWGYRQILAHYYPGTTLRREGAVDVRVLLADGRSAVTIGSKRAFRVTDGRGRSRVIPAGQRRIAGGALPLTFRGGARVLTLDGAAYRGALVVSGSRGNLSVVNDLPLERYLRGVVPWEMPHRWEAAALRAQAVAARSYALATLRHRQDFDLYADTRDQVYGGVRAETPPTNQAVGATSREVLTWDGAPALTYYSSTSGGRTAAAQDSLPWARAVPYLRSVPDPYDSLSPHHSWGPYTYRGARIAELLRLPGVRRIELVRNGSGRVSTVRIGWQGGSTAVEGRTFQSDLGLPSTWFSIGGAKSVVRRGTPMSTQVSTATHVLSGYVVVLASVPLAGGKASAQAQARHMGAHVLRSDEYSGLNPGYWVVYRGPFASRAAAQAAATGGGYVRPLGG